jgi:hypothetical protein
MLKEEIGTKPYLTEQIKGNLNKPYEGLNSRKKEKEAWSI